MAIARPAEWRMLARLERETRDQHARAEADRYRVLDMPTVAGYRRFLAAIYHFEYAFEAALVRVPDLSVHFVHRHLRSGKLCGDLLALGDDAVVVELFGRELVPPSFTTPAEALAWLYAIERNTLHHETLYRALVPRIRSALQTSSRYLAAFFGVVHKRWHELAAELERAAVSPEVESQMIEAAHDAFDAQRGWYFEAGIRPASRSAPTGYEAHGS